MTHLRFHLLRIAAPVVLLWSIAASSGAADLKILTQVIETSTDVTPLPTRVPSTMTIRACQNCPVFVLRVDESTGFTAAHNESVTLPELRQACRQTTTGISVSYDARTKLVKRLFTNCPVARARTRTGS